jgi:diamine N-acetyltransferase
MIAYRDGGIEDAAAVGALFHRGFSDTFAHLYEAEDLAAFFSRFTGVAWREEFADPAYAFRLAEDGDELAGYVKIGPVTLPVETGRNAIELRQLYVLTPWQGAGIAPVLMDWAIGEARRRRAEELYLTVFTDNHRAKRFYARYGFDAVGRYDFMVGSHADEDIIMRLKL